MNITILTLRVLHIGFGTFWVGTDIFITFLLLPRLRALGPQIERSMVAALMRIVPPAMMIGSIVTAVSGVWLAGILRGWSVNWVLASGWGTAIFVGFIGTVIALFVGFGLLPPLMIRSDKLERGFEGREPTAMETNEFDQLKTRATRLAKLNSVILIVVVISMAVARFV